MYIPVLKLSVEGSNGHVTRSSTCFHWCMNFDHHHMQNRWDGNIRVIYQHVMGHYRISLTENKQRNLEQTPHFAASDQGIHCLFTKSTIKVDKKINAPDETKNIRILENNRWRAIARRNIMVIDPFTSSQGHQFDYNVKKFSVSWATVHPF